MRAPYAGATGRTIPGSRITRKADNQGSCATFGRAGQGREANGPSDLTRRPIAVSTATGLASFPMAHAEPEGEEQKELRPAWSLPSGQADKIVVPVEWP